MKEIRDILAHIDSFAADERAVLATVVDLQGSGYRLPGARMLIAAEGGALGTVSGGCLEADVLERAKKVLENGNAEVFTYDTTANETSVFSLNMGCRGVIKILLEAVTRESDIIRRLGIVYQRRRPAAIATLISVNGAAHFAVGGRVFLNDGGQPEFENTLDALADLPGIGESLLRFAASGRTCDVETFDGLQATYEFAFEAIEPPLSILLFGAGADAVPMARIADELGWQVTVFDHRPAFLTIERFPAARQLVRPDADGAYPQINADGRTAAVIMTHNYGRDRDILPAVLRTGAFYVGALGPKRRTEQLLAELTEAGSSFTSEQLGRLYAPIGLDIGSDTPEAIAMSIAAEIQSVLKGRLGSSLRERQGSIYDRRKPDQN